MTLNVTDLIRSPQYCVIIVLCGRVRQGAYQPAVSVLGATDKVRTEGLQHECQKSFVISSVLGAFLYRHDAFSLSSRAGG